MIIADSDHDVFTTLDQLAKRHRNKAFAVKKSGVFVEVRGDNDDNVNDSNSDDSSPDGNSDDGMMTICHKPGTPAEQTMAVSNDALEDHLGHGDTIGACGG